MEESAGGQVRQPTTHELHAAMRFVEPHTINERHFGWLTVLAVGGGYGGADQTEPVLANIPQRLSVKVFKALGEVWHTRVLMQNSCQQY